ncbi:MAG TPA: AAA family ATPase [Candidatus Paceibacterota bacterium]
MYLKSLELSGFKSFGKKETLDFNVPIASIVGPNGSGKSNIAEAFRFVLGEQSLKSMRGKKGEDLIWGGGKHTARANRASVKVVFDNSKRLFDLDFDEVSIERTVHRDGVNQYAINGTQVRLRDIVEMLAAANIGSSGHHIISQGEADRILNTSPRERREMIEDALGLRVYHYKLAESGKKLEKTRENIEQVVALRKEIAPHLRFLQKQVERVEKTRLLREDLKQLYEEYLKRESTYLSWLGAHIERERKEPMERLEMLERALKDAKATLEREHKNDEKSNEIIELETTLRIVREEKDVLARDSGRLEGELRAEERNRARFEQQEQKEGEKTVSLNAVRRFAEEIKLHTHMGESLSDVLELRGLLRKVRDAIFSFIAHEEQLSVTKTDELDGVLNAIARLRKEQEEKAKALSVFNEKEKQLQERYKALQKDIESVRDTSREAERNMFAIMAEQNELRNTLNNLINREKELIREKEQFDREVEEGAVLIGRSIFSYEHYRVASQSGDEESEENIATENRNEQDKRRRDIEKIKIRIEELGSGGGEEILKEYEEIENRNQFLEREITDLEHSAESLKTIMAELEEKLRTQFRDGIVKINKEFENFFTLMFGGGSASLVITRAQKRKQNNGLELVNDGEDDEMIEEEVEEGIDIAVSLPKKRIKGLVMLSGGERALTSIALLFAMSQVNPPPFLILDETDAALDEANSRRYGDMIENLSTYSQLIVITHNRETMSRAHVLYGVTMGSEGLSKLLSIKFDEAVQVAK